MSTRQQIIETLKTTGQMTSKALAEQLGLTSMAIKLQLYDLKAEGFVQATVGPRSRGRPSDLWSLTERADQFFPNSHATLSYDILIGIRKALGERALDQVLELRSAEQYERYAREIGACASLNEKLARLATLRSEEGYMAAIAEVEGVPALVENHCPICVAAKACVKLCATELDLFQKTLGDNYVVERTEHIVSGSRRCVYRVTPRPRS